MSTTRAALLGALASGLLLTACSEQKKEIAGPPNLRATLNAGQSGVCPTSLDPNDTSCLKSTGASFSSTPGDPGTTSNGSLKIAYINDNENLLGFEAVQAVVAAEELGTVERLTIKQVLDGALEEGGYHVVFHGRHYGGPSTGDPPTDHPFTRVPAGLRSALDAALAKGVGFIAEWQGGSPVWTVIGSDFNYYQMTETSGDLWKWYQGTVDRGDATTWLPSPLSFTRTATSHPVTEGLDASFTLAWVEYCYRVHNPDPSLQVLATITDLTGSVRPAILAGKRSKGRVVLWPCDWADNQVAPPLDPNVHRWIANSIRWAAEGTANETEQKVPAGQAAVVAVKEECDADPNGCEVAGIDIPAGTFSEDVTVTVRLEKLEAGEKCHDYLIGQVNLCLEISAKNDAGEDAAINEGVTPIVGLCLPEESELDIFKFRNRTARARALRQTAATFLQCDGFETTASAAPRNWLEGLAMGVAKRVGRWVSPKPLYAADKGFGGFVEDDHLSFYTWAPALQITGAVLAANVANSGKDAYTFWGTFGLEAKDFNPGQGEAGFNPAIHKVLVGFGEKEHTIPINSFKWSEFLKRYIYAAKVPGSGITFMEIDPLTGKFLVAGTTTPSEGSANPTTRKTTIRIENRERGGLLVCGEEQWYKCKLQH